MEINILQLNNMMSGIDFRSSLNTNFENIKNAFESLDNVVGNNTLYTDEFDESTGFPNGSLQVVCNDTGIKIYQFEDNEWQLVCEYDSTMNNYIVFEKLDAGIGYPVENKDNSLEGKPVGYINGSKVLAGISQGEDKDPVHCVGWYKGGYIVKTGRIELNTVEVAGTPVYVKNEDGGWTIETPVISGQLIQVIGFISDDGKYIDIDIQPWCVVA